MDKFEELDRILEDHFGTNSVRAINSEEGSMEQVDVSFDDDILQDQEVLSLPEKDIDKLSTGCTCSKKCFTRLERKVVIEHNQNVRELSKQEKDMYIMGALKVNGSTAKKNQDDIKRHRFCYFFNGAEICVAAFRVIYGIGEDMLKSIAKHVVCNGITPRVHGNSGRRAPNALIFEFDEYKRVKTFITTYTDDYGLPQPAAARGRDEDPPIYRPASHYKKHVYQVYKEASHAKCVGTSVFYDLWKKLCPNIKISTPKDDVCFKCELHRKRVEDERSEEEKIEATRSYLLHIEEARREREAYKMCVDASKEELLGYVRQDGEIQHQSSNLLKMHYTFDFAQSLILPHHARQIGQLYFTTPRKIHLFGVRLDGLSMQLNYMIDEDETIGTDGSLAHGPNSVISMIHHAFQTYGLGEIDCSLHADNCGGQNKNRFVLGYFCWRVLVGLHRNISFMLQIPGHTRCLVDAGFGQIKKLYRRTDCDTKGDIARVIELSSKSNRAVSFLEEDAWVWRDWKSYLSLRFKALKGIQQYQHFRFSADAPGCVFVKKRADSEETKVSLLVKEAPASSMNDLPVQLTPGGLTEERQRYLYRFVRHLVKPAAQDLTCPAPEE